MKILVYEYFSGGGLNSNQFSSNIFCEGLGMLKSLIEDFITEGHSVTTILDSRFPIQNYFPIEIDKVIHISQLDELEHIINQLSSSIDAAYIIAPENNKILQTILKMIKKSGIVSLNCSISGINKVYNKSNLSKLLKKYNIKTPKSIKFKISDKLAIVKKNIKQNFCYPIIIKPSKGINCEGMSLIQNEQELKKAILKIKTQTTNKDVIAQEFIKGTNSSINVLASDNKAIAISLNKQRIDFGNPNNKSEYVGGIIPFESPFEVAKTIVESIKGLIGFIGIDIILTDDDIVIVDINPRITTSYVGLKKVIKINMANALLDCVFEKKIPTEVKYDGYIYFFKVKKMNRILKSLVSNNQIEEIITPFPESSAIENTCSIISVKGSTKNGLYEKIEKLKRILKLDVLGGK